MKILEQIKIIKDSRESIVVMALDTKEGSDFFYKEVSRAVLLALIGGDK